MISVFSKMLSRRPHLIPPEAGKGTTRSHYLPIGRLAFRRAEKIKLFESADRRNEVDVVVMKFSKEMQYRLLSRHCDPPAAEKQGEKEG